MLTVVKAITINGNNDIYECLKNIYHRHNWGTMPNTITRNFLANCTPLERRDIQEVLSEEIYNSLVTGDIDLIAVHLWCAWDNSSYFEVFNEWYYKSNTELNQYSPEIDIKIYKQSNRSE